MKRRRPRNLLWILGGYGFAAPYLVLFLLFLVLPLVFGLVLSLCRWEMLSATTPEFVWFRNYTEALGDPYFWRALRATLVFVVLAVPLTVSVSLGLALMIAALPRRQALYRTAFVLPTMLNISVAGILWRWFFNSEFGLFNALLAPLELKFPWITSSLWAMPAIVLMTVWWTAGGPMLVLLAGLNQIPGHYYEAAALDGASAWKRFRHITLPLLRPVMLFVVVMNLIGAFQVFGQTFMITRGGPELSTRVLVQYIYEVAFNHYRMGYGAAMSWLLFLIIAGLSLLQFRLAGRPERA